VQKTKSNLMVFIRPRIIRNAEQAAIETNTKYNYIRNLQLGRNDGKVQLMPNTRQPTLPELETSTLATPESAPTEPPAVKPGTEPVTPVPGLDAATEQKAGD
jgi:general secretion pathway protein D